MSPTPHPTTSEHARSIPVIDVAGWRRWVVLPLPAARSSPESRPAQRTSQRWDDADVAAWEGTYGDHLTRKVAKVFPDLFDSLEAQ